MAKTLNKPNELYLTRIFDAPVKSVWDAWIDPEKAAHWWGPRGFTITTHSSDKKTGGLWHYTMYGPDGATYVNKTRYIEVEEYSHMLYDHGGNDERKPLFRVDVRFTDLGEKTKMDMTMIFSSPEETEKSKKFIKKAGGDSTWDRFAEYLSSSNKFFINRSFDAPLDKVWEAWTDPKKITQWLAPKGATMTILKGEIKTGGEVFYCMPMENGGKLYGKVNFMEVKKPRQISTQAFCDENGKISRHPFAPTWPETMLRTVTLTEEGPEKTRVTVVWEVYGKATDAERETFTKSKADMTQGWTGSFDKLEDYLPKF